MRVQPAIKIFNRDNRQTTEVGRNRCCRSTEQGCQEESRQTDGNMSDYEVRENLVGFGDLRREMLASELVECPEQSAYQHEQGPYRDAERSSQGDSLQGIFVAFRGKITLHHRLISCVLLQVEEKTVQRQHNDRGLCESECTAAKAEFMRRVGGVPNRDGSSGGQKQQEADAYGDPDPKNETLNYISPDNCFQASNVGVKNSDCSDENDDVIGPERAYAAHGERNEINNERHLRKRAERECG